MNAMKLAKKIWTYAAIIGLAVICALNYHLFVFPNKFAPAGLGGVCTMIQYALGINVGWLNLAINVPLALIVFWKIGKSLAGRSFLFAVVFSGMLIVLEQLDLSMFIYETDNGTSTILGPLVAGVINGWLYSVIVRMSSTTGGMDLVSALIRHHRPDLNFFWISFAINVCVAFASYFVYGFQIEPVILCILYCFMTSTVSDRLTKAGNAAVRCEIITDHPDELSHEIIEKLHHTATMMPAKGMYRDKETSVLVCVVNRTQRKGLADLVKSFPNSFAVFSDVTTVVGNFKRLDRAGNPEKDLIDKGDGITV